MRSFSLSSGSPSFGIIQTDAGTSPTATSSNAVLTFTSSNGSVVITGNSATNTINLTAGTGSVTSVSVVTANGVSGSVANPTTTPAITITLGAITPSSISTGSISCTGLAAGSGTVTGASACFSGAVNAGCYGGTWNGNTIPISKGGTGATDATTALGNLLPSQGSNTKYKFLQSSGSSGQATVWASSPYVIFDHFTDAGNSTTTETDLYSDTIAAGLLANNGDKLNAYYAGIFVSSATATREIRIYFGGTMIFDTGALTLSLSAAWIVYLDIIRVSSTVIRYAISLTTEGAALAAYTASGELTGLTLGNANVLKITGQAGGVGAATNDIVAQSSSTYYAFKA